MTAQKLNQYLAEWLGIEAKSDLAVFLLIEQGLPVTVIDHLLERGLARDKVFELIIPLRTLKHRRGRQQRLSTKESERVLRAARVLVHAQTVMGDQALALNWLPVPRRRFEGRAPLQMLGTEPGGRLVEQMLIQIDQGMLASAA